MSTVIVTRQDADILNEAYHSTKQHATGNQVVVVHSFVLGTMQNPGIDHQSGASSLIGGTHITIVYGLQQSASFSVVHCSRTAGRIL
eukprot:6174479-Pleurochrysis_carterae.AAC.6